MEKYRIVSDVGVYFVTFTVVEWLHVFTDEPSCKIITDSLNFCHEKKFLRIKPGVAGGYGNGSTSDYLSGSFAWNVVANTPIFASVSVDQAIIAQAATLP